MITNVEAANAFATCRKKRKNCWSCNTGCTLQVYFSIFAL